MQPITISDTSCLISLHKINQLELLKNLFTTIVVTTIIAGEFGESLPRFIKIIDPSEEFFHKIIQMNIDAGEASAIALALQNKEALVIIDDYKGRKIAKGFYLKVTGTLSILIEGKKKGWIESLKAILDQLAKTNFRLTPELIQRALQIAGE